MYVVAERAGTEPAFSLSVDVAKKRIATECAVGEAQKAVIVIQRLITERAIVLAAVVVKKGLSAEALNRPSLL
jgi:hypothetical protein